MQNAKLGARVFSLLFLVGGNFGGYHGATITGVYWGRSLRSLTGGGAEAPYWGALSAFPYWPLLAVTSP